MPRICLPAAVTEVARDDAFPERPVPATRLRPGAASARDPAARARRRRQRPDRPRAVLGAAAAGCGIPVTERSVPVRHGPIRPAVVQRAGPHTGGGARRGARGGADPRRLHYRRDGKTRDRREPHGPRRVLARNDDVAVRRVAPRGGVRRHPWLFRPPDRDASAAAGVALAPARPPRARHRRPGRFLRLAGPCRGGAARGGGAGGDAELRRHRPLDRRGRPAPRRRVSAERAQRAEALTGSPGLFFAEKYGSMIDSIFGVSHSASPSTRPRTLPASSIRMLVGSPSTLKASPKAPVGSRKIFRLARPSLSTKGWTTLVPPRSSDMASTVSLSPRLFCSASSSGISSTHG